MVISLIGAIDSGLIPLLAVLCMVMLSVSMLRRSRQRKTTSREVTREQLARLRDQKDVRQSMDELLIQLEDVSRRINAQVDTRFAKLECVIRDADERIAVLKRLSGAVEPDGVDESIPSASSSPPQAQRPNAPDSESQSMNASDADEFQPGLATASPGAGFRSPANGTSLDRDAQRLRIHELADAGTPPITIADSLQIPLGEVELILNLRGFGTQPD